MASKAWTRHRDTDRRTWTGRDDGSRAKQNANGSAHHRRSPSPATTPSFTQSLPFASRHHLLQLRSLMAAICTHMPLRFTAAEPSSRLPSALRACGCSIPGMFPYVFSKTSETSSDQLP